MNSRFFIQFAAFGLTCFVVLFGLQVAFSTVVVHPLAPWLLAGLLALTLLTYGFTAAAVRRSPDRFLVAYFGGVGLRLVLALGAILLYFWRVGVRENHGLLTFLGAFFLAYFLCAGFEILAIFSNLRPFSARQASKSE